MYVEDEQGLVRFHALGTPASIEVAEIARRTVLRLHRAFQKQGRQSPWDDDQAFVDSGEADPFSLEQPGLFACYQAAASGVPEPTFGGSFWFTLCRPSPAKPAFVWTWRLLPGFMSFSGEAGPQCP